MYNLQNQAEILKFKFRIILELENIVMGERVPLLKFCFVSPIIDVLYCYNGFIYQTQETHLDALFTKPRSLFKFHRYSSYVFFSFLFQTHTLSTTHIVFGSRLSSASSDLCKLMIEPCFPSPEQFWRVFVGYFDKYPCNF